MPAGCHVELDRVAQRIVLDNVKQSLSVAWKGLVAEAAQQDRPTLAQFLEKE